MFLARASFDAGHMDAARHHADRALALGVTSPVLTEVLADLDPGSSGESVDQAAQREGQ
jgi:hypothetical protein